MEFEAYLDKLASADPTPGGGSAATLVGALAASLCAMVARITLGSPKLAAVHQEAAAIVTDADDLRGGSSAAPARRGGFAVVVAAALPRGTDAEKSLARPCKAALIGAPPQKRLAWRATRSR